MSTVSSCQPLPPSLFTGPISPPVNCSNTTFFPHNVTLVLCPPSPPIDELDGDIIGYNLTCPDITSTLDTTLTSPATTITITSGIRPFSNYSSALTALNMNGSTPLTTCSFETAQDSECNACILCACHSLHLPPPPPSLLHSQTALVLTT